jgi:hypothetical protein
MTKKAAKGRVLECHSKGDVRFSPFFARVKAFGVVDTIEDHYQKSKVFVSESRDELLFPIDWRQAKHMQKQKAYGGQGLIRWPEFMLPNGHYVPNRYHVHGWYSSLWLKYLDAHPDLVEFAKLFDSFNDPYKHDFPLCQADCVRLYAKHGREALLEHCADFFTWLKTEAK